MPGWTVAFCGKGDSTRAYGQDQAAADERQSSASPTHSPADLSGFERTIRQPRQRSSTGRNPAPGAGFGLVRRRGRDLNPRPTEPPVTVFETAAFDRSATPPRPD